MIAGKINNSKILEEFPNIDGVVPITHSTGCGMGSDKSLGMQILIRTINGFKNHKK